jgi:hypothetical protein
VLNDPPEAKKRRVKENIGGFVLQEEDHDARDI